jgi:ribosomal subunit interface protein
MSFRSRDVRAERDEMQVQVQTDNHVEGREKLIEHVEGVILDAVDRYREQVTHVEAHLGDVNSGEKSGADDMRCMLEARVAGVKHIAVTHQAESLHLAIEGAADKLTKALDSTLGKLQDRQRRHAGTGELSAEAARELDDGGAPPT